jgi:chlorobactene lauroyltransferase
MIEAKHTKWAAIIFDIYIKRLLKKSFYNIELFGSPPEYNPEYPVILAPNHSTWWDGFFVYLINALYFKKNFYIMVKEKQLAKYKFFTKLGAFSVEQQSPKKIIQSLNYAVDLLNNEQGNSIFTIFPQGEMLPNNIRPLQFNKGIAKISQMYGKPLNIIPVAMKVELLAEQRPSVFFKFGKTFISNKDNPPNMELLSAEVTHLLDEITENAANGIAGEVIFSGNVSVSQKSKEFFGTMKNA